MGEKNMKIIATNKSASFEYFIEEKYEAGIVLEGNEIKSVRAGNVNMNDSFCFVRGNTVSVKNMHIALFDKSDAFSTKDTRRDRKLLLHKAEIAKISGKINRQGYTLVPLKMYFKDALIKMEIALCKGKHTYDKKQAIADRDTKRSVDRELKNAGF
ncbi:MAG: SsrA-binding protein SmpB [Clostridia bacterium]|nr:SsrA-binding protein SmpB [Clostridia bacterium]